MPWSSSNVSLPRTSGRYRTRNYPIWYALLLHLLHHSFNLVFLSFECYQMWYRSSCFFPDSAGPISSWYPLWAAPWWDPVKNNSPCSRPWVSCHMWRWGSGTLPRYIYSLVCKRLQPSQAFFEDLIIDETFVNERRYVIKRRLGMRTVDGVTSSVNSCHFALQCFDNTHI